MNLNTFIFDTDGRPRSGWRVMIFLLIWTACTAMLGFAVYAIFLSSGERRLGRLEEFALGSSISLAATLLAGWLCGRWLERLPFRALGAALSVRGLGHFAIGMAVGAGSLALAVAFAAMLGNYSFEFNGTVPAEEMIKSLLGSFLFVLI